MLKHGNRGLSSCTSRGLKNIVHFLQTGQYFVTDFKSSVVNCCGDEKCHNKGSETGKINTVEIV